MRAERTLYGNFTAARRDAGANPSQSNVYKMNFNLFIHLGLVKLGTCMISKAIQCNVPVTHPVMNNKLCIYALKSLIAFHYLHMFRL